MAILVVESFPGVNNLVGQLSNLWLAVWYCHNQIVTVSFPKLKLWTIVIAPRPVKMCCISLLTSYLGSLSLGKKGEIIVLLGLLQLTQESSPQGVGQWVLLYL